MRKSQKGESGFLKFEESWYDLNSDETPDGSSYQDEYDSLVGEA
jgi:hypothetical protein